MRKILLSLFLLVLCSFPVSALVYILQSPSGGGGGVVYTNGTGLLSNNNQFNLSTSYTDSLYCHSDGVNCLSSGGGNSSWNQSYADSLYYSRNSNPQSFYNLTTLPAYPTGDNSSWNQSYANTLYYSVSNPSAYISSYVETDPFWTVSRSSYVNYTSFLSIGNWTNDKGSYTLLSQLVGGVGQNLTHALIVAAEGNWSLDKSGYYTITSVNNIENGQNNFSLSQMVSNFGNWTQDKVSYTLLSQLPGAVGQNLTHMLVVQAEGNWSLDKTGYLQNTGFNANNLTSGTIPVSRLPLNNISFLPAYTDFIFLTGATTGSFSTADTVGRCTTFKIDFSDQVVFNNITLWVQTINNSVGVYFGIYNCTAGNAVNCTSGSLLINATTTTTTNRTGLVGFQNLTGSWTLSSGTYLSCMTSNFSNAIAVYRAATSTTGMPGTCSFSTKGGGMPTTAVLNCTAGNPAFTWLYS